jgi:ATP-dependent DNA ligase
MRRLLQAILPADSPTFSEPLSVFGRGSELFELMCADDLEGIVAKRLDDPYDPRVRWLKIKNSAYSRAGPSCSTGDGHQGIERPNGTIRCCSRAPQ